MVTIWRIYKKCYSHTAEGLAGRTVRKAGAMSGDSTNKKRRKDLYTSLRFGCLSRKIVLVKTQSFEFLMSNMTKLFMLVLSFVSALKSISFS